MAIVKYAAPIDEVRGTIGGVTFSANGAGQYAKRWAYPVVPNTIAQGLSKRLTTQYGAAWLAMSPTLRADWQTWANLPANERFNSLGQSYYMTGFQAWCSVQQICYRGVGAFRTAVPTGGKPAAPTITSVVLSSSVPYCVVNYPAGHFAGYWILIYASVYGRNTRSVVTRAMRFLIVAGNIGSASYTFSTYYQAVFGTPALGVRATFKIVRMWPNGWQSSPTYVTTTCV